MSPPRVVSMPHLAKSDGSSHLQWPCDHWKLRDYVSDHVIDLPHAEIPGRPPIHLDCAIISGNPVNADPISMLDSRAAGLFPSSERPHSNVSDLTLIETPSTCPFFASPPDTPLHHPMPSSEFPHRPHTPELVLTSGRRVDRYLPESGSSLRTQLTVEERKSI